MSLINDQPLLNSITTIDTTQAISASNCFGTYGCYWPQLCQCYQTALHPRQLQIEAVDGGFVIRGCFSGKADAKRVALSLEGLALVLGEWSAQFKGK